MITIHRTRRLLVASVLAGLGLTVTACNDGNAAQAPSTETVTVAADSAGSGDTSTAEPAADDSGASGNAGAQLPDNWPDADFPIPPGVTVQTKGENADEVGIILVGSSPEEIATFYRSALPTAGYKITEDNSVSVGGRQIIGLKFDGNGYHGEMAVVTGHVVISLDK
jgi:hypothetical protein